jgi:putative transposase
MANDQTLTERAANAARVLRPLGTKPMSREQATRAAQLLGLHWASVYRLRRRFLADPVASSLSPRTRGPKVGNRRLDDGVEQVIEEVLGQWLPEQRELAHPLLDLWMEVRLRCRRMRISAPARSTVSRRWAEHREVQAAKLAEDPDALIAPGNFGAAKALEIVQVDHTQADVVVVDEYFRRAMGRPWLSVAIDLATRCVVGIYVSMDRPSAATVALLLSRVALPKGPWLLNVGVDAEWPMHGIPKTLHLDNAAEFKSRALRAGCLQYGIELMYRPVGRPQFGGHVERMNRTLMQRLKGLPGATGNSTVGRKLRKSEERAVLTLKDFERWLILEVARRYHHTEHRGLMGATPVSAWQLLTQTAPARQLAPGPDEALRFLLQFMPLARRTIQGDGLTIFHIRYWHPIFAAWRETRRQVVVRYHPEDLSRIFVATPGGHYIEVRYADLRRPSISMWEQRAACRILRAQGRRDISEMLIFKAIEQQRRIVDAARSETRRVKRGDPARTKAKSPQPWMAPALLLEDSGEVDYSRSVAPFPVEIWEEPCPKP